MQFFTNLLAKAPSLSALAAYGGHLLTRSEPIMAQAKEILLSAPALIVPNAMPISAGAILLFGVSDALYYRVQFSRHLSHRARCVAAETVLTDFNNAVITWNGQTRTALQPLLTAQATTLNAASRAAGMPNVFAPLQAALQKLSTATAQSEKAAVAAFGTLKAGALEFVRQKQVECDITVAISHAPDRAAAENASNLMTPVALALRDAKAVLADGTKTEAEVEGALIALRTVLADAAYDNTPLSIKGQKDPVLLSANRAAFTAELDSWITDAHALTNKALSPEEATLLVNLGKAIVDTNPTQTATTRLAARKAASVGFISSWGQGDAFNWNGKPRNILALTAVLAGLCMGVWYLGVFPYQAARAAAAVATPVAS